MIIHKNVNSIVALTSSSWYSYTVSIDYNR